MAATLESSFNRPVPFAGTDEQRTANRGSHHFGADSGGEILCFNCEHKIWHVGADYPCGAEIPREEVKR